MSIEDCISGWFGRDFRGLLGDFFLLPEAEEPGFGLAPPTTPTSIGSRSRFMSEISKFGNS